MNLKPDMYRKSVYDINYDKLKKMNKKYLFFDLDNTIISYIEKEPDNNIISLFENLEKKDFKCMLFSNSRLKRVKKANGKLNTEVYYNSMKPFKRNYMKVLTKYKKSECVFIGDQFMTDILGAKRNNLFTILVDRINPKEPLGTKIWRLFEKIILKNYKRKNIFEKGKYYE